jgi:hypothetical protein
MSNENNNRKRSKKRSNMRRNRGVIRIIESRKNPSYPPQYNAKPKLTRNIRYLAGSSIANVDITGRCLLNLVLATNTATTTAVNVFEAVKVLNISMYYVPSSTANFGSSAEELILNWRGDRSPDTRLSDRGTLNHPSCIKSRPPRDSLAGFWITNLSNIDSVLFNVTVPAGTIIDVGLMMTIGDGVTRSVVLAAVGSTTGIEYMHLDNAIAAGTVGGRTLAPDSLTTQNIATP